MYMYLTQIEVLETLKAHDGPYMRKLDAALGGELSACRIVTNPHYFYTYIEAVLKLVSRCTGYTSIRHF